MSAVSRMPAVPESARNSLTNGRRNVATPIAAQRLHERSLWLGRERARVVASSVMAEGWDSNWGGTYFVVDDGEDHEIGWFRLPPVGNDTGAVEVRVLMLAGDSGAVFAIPTDDSGAEVGPRFEQELDVEAGLRWVTVSVQLPTGATSIRVGARMEDLPAAVLSVVVDTDRVEEMSDGIAAPAAWPKLSALFFEDADLDHSYDVDAIQRKASQHAHVAGRMPRTLAARSLFLHLGGTTDHYYRIRVARPGRPLMVQVLATARGAVAGELTVSTASANNPTIATLTQVGSPVPIPVGPEFAWYEVVIPAASAIPGAGGDLLDVRVRLSVSGEDEMGIAPVARAIRIEQLPSAMEDYDVTDGGRFACAPVRAIPADRFLPGDPVIDSFRLGPMQRMWSDRRTAVSNALFRAVDHRCVHVSDWFPAVETGSDPSEPQETDVVEPSRVVRGLRHNPLLQQWMHSGIEFARATPHAREVVGLLQFPPFPSVPWTSPLTALQTRHTVSADASEVVVMSRLWIENEGYGQRIWVSLWRDGLEVVPARPFEGHERGWREVGRIPVVPGETHDLEMKVALGDEQGPFDYLLPGPTILIPGIVAWEIPTEVSPSRVYWHGAVSDPEGAERLLLTVPESRDFEVRKVRIRGGWTGLDSPRLFATYDDGGPEHRSFQIRTHSNQWPDGAWFSDWRIGDFEILEDISWLRGKRAAVTWRLTANNSDGVRWLTHFELELE